MRQGYLTPCEQPDLASAGGQAQGTSRLDLGPPDILELSKKKIIQLFILPSTSLRNCNKRFVRFVLDTLHSTTKKLEMMLDVAMSHL